ncbi:unnamed protein product [Cyclocybe aegerita]|uniref:Uncharacterized protein n=1 Tax=Cyclocybe aegerita TaxID=1973307 RepID=A0A8S0WNY0_CYCAE|nr:unnamed protein product [Cyclocybe aegerita]
MPTPTPPPPTPWHCRPPTTSTTLADMPRHVSHHRPPNIAQSSSNTALGPPISTVGALWIRGTPSSMPRPYQPPVHNGNRHDNPPLSPSPLSHSTSASAQPALTCHLSTRMKG